MELFPENRLAAYQKQYKPLARQLLSTASPEPLSLQELLALADNADLERWQKLSLGYASSQGDERLRTDIAGQYPGLDAGNIVCFAGAQEAIFACYQALVGSADQVNAITPLFEPLVLAAQGIGAWINFCAMDYRADTGWQLDMDKWLELMDADTRLAAINFPHNPTGSLITLDEQRAIIDKVRQHGTWLLSDEVFRGLEYREGDRLPPAACEYERAISLGVVSKAYGLGGVRVGWIATQDQALIDKLLEIKEYLSICNGVADELLATIAIKNSGTLWRRNVDIIQANIANIERQPDLAFDWIAPRAGCLAFPRLKEFDDARIYSQALLKNTGALVLPGDCFLHGQAHIRLGLGVKNLPLG